ncbi:hypothetical protein PS1_027681 [Malus domestica]
MSVRDMGDTAVVRVRHEFPYSQILKAAEQDDGHGGDIGGGFFLVLHTLFNWLLMLKVGWGLVGATVVGWS